MTSQLVAKPSCTGLRSSSSVRGQQLHLSQKLAKQSVRRVVSAAKKGGNPEIGRKSDVQASPAEDKKDKGPFKAPALDPSTPSPIFGGSTGGLLRKAQV